MLAILACPSRDSGDAWDADEVSERALGQAPKAIHHAGAGVVHQLDRALLTGLEAHCGARGDVQSHALCGGPVKAQGAVGFGKVPVLWLRGCPSSGRVACG